MDSYQERALEVVSSDPQGVVAELATRHYRKTRDLDEKYNLSRTKIKVAVNLSSNNRVMLQEQVYPHLDLEFMGVSSSSHGLAYARRMIEQELMIRKCISSETVGDIGGNFAVHLRLGRVNMHCCCPIIDARDGKRDTERRYDVRKWMDKVFSDYATAATPEAKKRAGVKYHRAKAYLDNPDAFHCVNSGQFCPVKSRTLIFGDSLYDISFSVLGAIFDKKGCEIAYGNMTFSAEMLLNQSGYVAGMDCEWRRYWRESCEFGTGSCPAFQRREQIEFVFRGCANLGYTHDYLDFIRMATQSAFVTAQGKTFVLERTVSKGQMAIVFALSQRTEVATLLSYKHWREDVEESVVVRIFDYNGLGKVQTATGITWRNVLVDRRLVYAVLEYAVRLDAAKFTPETVYQYACGKNHRGTINGVDISVIREEDPMTLAGVSFTCWFKAFMVKYQRDKLTDFFVNRELSTRRLREASWAKVAARFFLDKTMPTLSATLYGGSPSSWETCIEKMRLDLANDFQSCQGVPDPDFTLPEPTVSLEEELGVVLGTYSPAVYPAAEYQRLVDYFEGAGNAEQIKLALSELAGKLRATSEGDAERSTLENAYAYALRRLSVLDPEGFPDATAAWSEFENAERVLDQKAEMLGGKVGSHSTVSSLESLTPEESASNVADNKPELTAEAKVEGGEFVPETLKLTYYEKDVYKSFSASFEEGFSLQPTSGYDGMCGAFAVHSALTALGADVSFSQTIRGLQEASNGIRTSWFEAADIAAYCATLGFGAGFLVRREGGENVLYGFMREQVAWFQLFLRHWEPLVTTGALRYTYELVPYECATESNENRYPVPCVEEITDDEVFDACSPISVAEKVAGPAGVDPSDEVVEDFAQTRGTGDLFSDGFVPVGETRHQEYKSVGTPFQHAGLRTPQVQGTGDALWDGPAEVFDQLGFSSEDLKGAPVVDEENLHGLDGGSLLPADVIVRLNVERSAAEASGRVIGQFKNCLLACRFWGIWLFANLLSFFGNGAAFRLRRGLRTSMLRIWQERQDLPVIPFSQLTVMEFRRIVSRGAVFFVNLWVFVKLCGLLGVAFEFTRANFWKFAVAVSFILAVNVFLHWATAKVELHRGRNEPMCDVVQDKYEDIKERLRDDKRAPRDRFIKRKVNFRGRSFDHRRVAKEFFGEPVKDNCDRFIRSAKKNYRATGTVGASNPKPTRRDVGPDKEKVSTGKEVKEGTAQYAKLSRVDRARVLDDRTTLLASYMDYLQQSIANYTAHCDNVWENKKLYGDAEFTRRYKKERDTGGAEIMRSIKPGVFNLPRIKLPDDKGFSFVYVRGERRSGELRATTVTEGKMYVAGNPESVLVFKGMVEFLDFLTYRALRAKTGIQAVEPTRTFRLVEGVPGCAKSTEIVNSVRKGDRVAVASRSANSSLQDKLREAGKEPSLSRTIGSRLIGAVETCERLFIDEGLKVHPGELIALAEVTGAKEVIVMGDSCQNGFNARVPGYVMADRPMHWVTEYRTHSYTVCQDSVVAVARLKVNGQGSESDGKGYYLKGFTTSSKVQKSITKREILSEGDVPRIPAAKYITFTQEDKRRLVTRGFEANTIDEFQGGRRKHVILVRLRRNMDVKLRHSSQQAIVALTRHTERFEYLTVEQPAADRDLVFTLCDRLATIDDISRAYGAFSGGFSAKERVASMTKGMVDAGGYLAPGLSINAPLLTMQSCLDDVLPGCGTVDKEFDNEMIESASMRMSVEGDVKFKPDRVPAILKPRKTLKPKLNTTMPPPRQTTFRQAMLSLSKRNLGAAVVGEPMNYSQFARDSLVDMLDVFGVSDWRQRVRAFEPILPNRESTVEWESAQSQSTLRALERIQPDVVGQQVRDDMTTYEFILKASPKASTDTKPLSVYPSVQTVMFHQKHVNALFGPMVREADSRFRSLLRPNVLYNKGKNKEEIEGFLNLNYVPPPVTTIVENDFSDYDRGQEKVAHFVDMALLAMMGLQPDHLAEWMRAHYKHRNVNFQLGLVVTLMYQRKSGDVTTSFGNTVFNMTALVFGLRLKVGDVVCAMFLGDDSWLQLRSGETLPLRVRGCSERIATHFNAEAKTASYRRGYFCGYYIISDGEKMVMAADPIKRAVKLGRWDVKGVEVLHENWVSFGDIMQGYERMGVQEALCKAVCERTPRATPGNVELIIQSLNSLRASFKEFRNFYDDGVTVTSY